MSPVVSSPHVDAPISLTPERVVLVGFMASGKTEVGRELAKRLGWSHIDLDDEIVRREGRPIDEIFATGGEPAFRALEVAVTPEVIGGRRIVVSTGGGWVTNPGVLDSLPSDTATVYLAVTPRAVLRRLARPGQPLRPLLATHDPGTRVAELMAVREPLYRRADYIIQTDGLSPAEIAERIHCLIQADSSAGPPTQTT